MSKSINELTELGLMEYEAKAYNTLLEQNLLSASDIAKISGVPRGRIYDIINQLIEKGFCITIPGTVKKFKAVDPESAIRNLIEQQRKREQTMLEISKKLQSRYTAKKEKTPPIDFIKILTSKQSQIKNFHELETSAEKFIFSFSKGPYITSTVSMEDIKNFSQPLKDMVKRGIKAKGIYEIPDSNVKEFIQWIKYFEQIGEEVRVNKNLPMKMLISDNNAVMLSLRNEGVEKNNLLSMVVEHSDLTTALINLFDFYWNTSMTINEFSKEIKNQL